MENIPFQREMFQGLKPLLDNHQLMQTFVEPYEKPHFNETEEFDSDCGNYADFCKVFPDGVNFKPSQVKLSE